MDKKTEEFYTRLREELNNTSTWPGEYLYKFIVPTDPKKIEEVENKKCGVLSNLLKKSFHY
jgi:hypothetical protein